MRRKNGNYDYYQPYKNMKSRYIALAIGLALSIVSFVAVVIGALMVFVPGFNLSGVDSPMNLLVILLSASIGCAFFGAILAVAGANTKKGIAQLAFFFCVLAFIAGAAMLTVTLFFKTLLPLDALNRLGMQFIATI